MISKNTFFEVNTNRYWPAYEDPLPDELFSSWLVRIAHLHGLKSETFCKLYWKKYSFWNRDIDRFYYSIVSDIFFAKSRVPPDKLADTFLTSYEGCLFESTNYKGNQNWILPLGIYHRTRNGFGQMYCPQCLHADELINKPYFRKSWRLSLSVVCVKCKCWLNDRCPHCNSPVIFFRNELGIKSIIPDVSLAQCYNCLKKLSNQFPEKSVDEEILDLQLHLNQILTVEKSPINSLVYPFQYFDVLHHILRLVNSKSPTLSCLKRSLCQIKHIEYWESKGLYSNRFDALPIEERAKLLLLSQYLLENWPNHFLEVVYPIKKLRSAWLLKDLSVKHFWFEREVMMQFYITNSNRPILFSEKPM